MGSTGSEPLADLCASENNKIVRSREEIAVYFCVQMRSYGVHNQLQRGVQFDLDRNIGTHLLSNAWNWVHG